MGALRPSESERPQSRREMPEVQLGPWGERVEVKLVNPELLDVCEGGEVSQTPGVKGGRLEPRFRVILQDPEAFHESQ